MLRDLGTVPERGVPRKAEKDPDDSVFLVLLAYDVGDVRSWNVASVWLTKGEAEGAVRRYVTEGHKAQHGWSFAVSMEYQTGQLEPKSERHGNEERYQTPAAVALTVPEQVASLELEVAKLRAQLGITQSVGVTT